jgi:hypothetical protein
MLTFLLFLLWSFNYNVNYFEFKTQSNFKYFGLLWPYLVVVLLEHFLLLIFGYVLLERKWQYFQEARNSNYLGLL